MIKINQEFKTLIPPLSNDEYLGLEQSIKHEGCRDSICIWDGFIIDGHNRHEICTKHEIEYNTKEIDFDNKDDVIVWIIKNQFGRRNITNYTRSVLALKLEEHFRNKAKENSVQSAINTNTKLGVTGCQISDNPIKDFETKQPESIIINKIDTKKELSKIANVSHDTIMKVKAIEQKATPETKQKLSSGEVSINQVYNEIKSVAKKEELLHKKEEYIKQASDGISNMPKVYHSNCNDFLNTFQDNSIDLLFTDPPYSTDIVNISEFASDWLNIAIEKIKPNGRAYICIGAYPKEINAYLNVLLNQEKFIIDNPLIWTYRNTLGVTPKMKYNLNYQIILHLYSNDSPELDTSITNEMFNVQDINAPDGRLGNRLHTWQKPDELARRLIRHSTRENDLIVDCFTCSGTFLLEAARLKRRAVGCDIDINNLKIAVERGCELQ